MSSIRPYIARDADDVLALYRKVFARVAPDAAARYVAALTSNPWREDDITPLVYEDRRGAVIGFVGVIPRRMVFQGDHVRAAVLSSFMVDPGRGTPLVAAALLRSVLDGPQDVTYGDGANDEMRRLWQSNGRSVVAHLSMRWVGVVRPTRFLARRLAHRGAAMRAVGSAFDLVSPLVDRSLVRVTRSTTPVNRGGRVSTRPMTTTHLAAHIEGITDRALRPAYTADQLTWLLTYLGGAGRSQPVTSFCVELEDRDVGWVVMRRSSDGTNQVLQIGSIPGHAGDVLRAAFELSVAERAVSVQGRVDARMLGELWDQGCVLIRGPWFLVDAPNHAIIDAVHSGDAFISSLEKASLPFGW